MSAALEPPYGARDAGDMAARLIGIPDQIDEALARGAASPWIVPAAAPDLLAVGALGGSAMSADLTATLYADRSPRPMLTVREYRWPACVTRASLALLSSYSGNTEETLALYREAGARGIPRVAITTGGALAESCTRDGVPFATLPGGSPPRAALFGSWVAVTRLVAALGWVDDPTPAWREAAQALRSAGRSLAPDVPEAQNRAKRTARALHGCFVFIYSGSERLGPVATRVRTQLNENAKLLAHSALVPELNHNEIVGWERPAVLGERAAVLILRDAEDPPEVTTRLSLTADYVKRQGGRVVEFEPPAGGRLARMASVIQFGDYVSFYAALLNQVDPTPIASIDEFKRRLAEWGAGRAR